MLSKSLIAAALFAAAPAFAATYTFQQGAGGYDGTMDVTMYSSDPDASSGYEQEVSIDASDNGSPNHVLLRFDNLFGSAANQIKTGETVVSATLTLQITSAGSGIRFYDMLSDWNSASATWNTMGDGIQTDGIEAAALPFLTIGSNNSDPNIESGTLVLDFTDALRRMQDGGVPGYGWALLPFEPNGTNGIDFYSAEGFMVSDRPLLTVEVAPVPEPETYALLLAGLGLIVLRARRRD
ncbi:DNRLRE domain-containing protein [Methyloversatilis discipulorum]|uniref:DNRLRE domain-containing protein n=1 Tax=Methyloversatilis discipulorum TaxID=1119528 RepID=UPI003137745A